MAAAPTRPNQREHILDVALRLMSEHGASRTSMRQLATCWPSKLRGVSRRCWIADFAGSS